MMEDTSIVQHTCIAGKKQRYILYWYNQQVKKKKN